MLWLAISVRNTAVLQRNSMQLRMTKQTKHRESSVYASYFETLSVPEPPRTWHGGIGSSCNTIFAYQGHIRPVQRLLRLCIPVGERFSTAYVAIDRQLSTIRARSSCVVLYCRLEFPLGTAEACRWIVGRGGTLMSRKSRLDSN